MNAIYNSSYAELKKQIAALEAEAEAARKIEIESVIADIKAKINDYELTAKDLGFVTTEPAVAKPSRSSQKVEAKYRSPEGLLWSGRGRKPNWVIAAIDAGHSVDDFLIAQ